MPWAGLILDEGQFVKNHRGKTYRWARDLDVPFKFAITSWTKAIVRSSADRRGGDALVLRAL